MDATPFKVPVQGRASPRFKSPKLAGIRKRTTTRMLSFTEAHETRSQRSYQCRYGPTFSTNVTCGNRVGSATAERSFSAMRRMKLVAINQEPERLFFTGSSEH